MIEKRHFKIEIRILGSQQTTWLPVRALTANEAEEIMTNRGLKGYFQLDSPAIEISLEEYQALLGKHA